MRLNPSKIALLLALCALLLLGLVPPAREGAHRKSQADAPPADRKKRQVDQKAEQADVQPRHAGQHRRDARHAARRNIVRQKERGERERGQQRAHRQQQIIPNQLSALRFEIDLFHFHPHHSSRLVRRSKCFFRVCRMLSGLAYRRILPLRRGYAFRFKRRKPSSAACFHSARFPVT